MCVLLYVCVCDAGPTSLTHVYTVCVCNAHVFCVICPCFVLEIVFVMCVGELDSPLALALLQIHLPTHTLCSVLSVSSTISHTVSNKTHTLLT